VVQLFRGELGQAYGGFPKTLQDKVLQGQKPYDCRLGEILKPVDLEATRQDVQQKTGREVSDTDLCSYLMYPKVYLDYMHDRQVYGPVSDIPTRCFFYGMEPGEEVSIDLERGKTLIIRFVALSEVHEDGTRTAFFELNGQPRSVRVADRSRVATKPARRRAELANDKHVAAPMPGVIATIHVQVGSKVIKGEVLATIEAMKMETVVRAERDGVIATVVAAVGESVDAKDLLLEVA
jgi:pyruvate carboxylase